ncbi:hypothetical protein LCGC14_1141280 [marine sediment metagenome]|uniref:Uncharacterized protein n=1 Tax=marine sediment metagenome TaxID=412755 RepID=A0A0F9LY49_9ZZZZ
MPKGQLLKRWNDWSAGVGHLVDDGRTPGMYYASGLLGLRGELRPAPFINTSGGTGNAIAGYTTSGSTAFGIAAVALQPADSGTAVSILGDTGAGVTNNTTLTFNGGVTVAQGDNRCLVVTVASTGGSAPTGVTHDGNAMTSIGNVSSGSTLTLSLWQLVATTTFASIVVTFAGAVDIVGLAEEVINVDQTTPIGTFYNHSSTATTNPAAEVVEDCEANSAILCCIATQNVTVTPPSGQDIFTIVENSTIRGAAGSFKNPGLLGNPNYHFQYFFEESETADADNPFLYAVRGHDEGTLGVYASKIILANTNFGNIQAGHHEISAPFATKLYAGQPARYQGLWFFPAGNDWTPRELTTVGSTTVAGDTLTAAGSGFAPGADHFANLGPQLVSAVQDGTNGGGARILVLDGAPRTSVNWGSVFQVGDKNERPAGLRSLQGASFVLNREGLFSFNSKGRSGLVFEDLRSWPSTFKNGVLVPREGGLLFRHPSGLRSYLPGEPPEGLGLDSQILGKPLPPAGPTEVHGGFYHGVVVVGDFTYSLYQQDPNTDSALILVTYKNQRGNVSVTQSLGTSALPAVPDLNGCTVVLNGTPISSAYTTPTLFFGDGSDLRYIILDPRASPFRARADTHRVNISADAYMSELRFTEPVDLTDLIIRTSADMVSGDEFQISLLVNGSADDIDVGPPAKGSGTRHIRTLDRKRVRSVVLHMNWTGTSAADRVPPVIQSIELYGKPTVGGEEQ